MILPPLQGSLNQPSFFIYAAADSRYFDEYGIPLINSVLRNTNLGVHVHIYNPSQQQLDWCCSRNRVSVSWENIAPGQFDQAIARWTQPTLSEPDHSRRNKMLGIKSDHQPRPGTDDVITWLYKTYYACMRFVRLAELTAGPREFLAIDIDGLVRANFDYHLDNSKDFFLYQKEKGGHLAGAILTTATPGSYRFIAKLAADIRREIEADNIYWFLDQNCLDRIVDSYQKGLLPINYIDWHMNASSAIWSAKGKRKLRDLFQQELQKYR